MPSRPLIYWLTFKAISTNPETLIVGLFNKFQNFSRGTVIAILERDSEGTKYEKLIGGVIYIVFITGQWFVLFECTCIT